MACPVCPIAGWFGGCIGGYLGVNPPQHRWGRILSAVLTATLVSVTLIALKVFLNISLCAKGSFLRNILQIGLQTLILGIIYSIGVNYLLNRYVIPYFEGPEKEDKLEKNHSCCCKK